MDADRDGLQDLHVCSTPHINLPGQNVFFRNNGQTFTDATEEAGISSDGGWSRASAVGDFNGDGLADMAICKSAPSYSSVWRAQENQNHWLKVTLEGVVSNRDGVSAWIDCYSPAGRQSRYTYCGEGYLGQNSFSEFLGFGSYNRIDSLLVTWPSGIVDRWYNIPTNQSLYLVEGSSRRAEIAAADGLVFCEDGFVGLSLGGWQEVEWNNGVGEAYIEVSQQGLAWAFVTDEWGNQFLSDTVLVSQNVVPGIEVIVQDVTCHGLSDGMITLFSDVGGIEFLLNGQPLSDLQNGSMGAGIYELTWTDILGCSGDFTAVITEPDTFEVAVFPQDVTCYGASDGWVDFSFNGGVEGYSILGEDVQLIDLPAGSYNYVASDGNGCLALVPFTIAEPAPLDVQVFSEPDSNGMSSGIIWCLLSGGTPPYQTMLNGEISAQAYWDSLPSGMYALEVTDSQGCLQSLIVEVEFVSQILESAEETIHIYPNPTHSGAPLTVRAPFNVYECVVFDAQGRVLSFMRPGASQFEMNISGYAPGLYVVSLRSEAKHYNHCVVLSVE